MNLKERFTEARYKNHEMSKPTRVQARQKDTRVFKYKVHLHSLHRTG